MEEILRDQAVVLRSLADELESVADALERDKQQTIPQVRPTPIMDSGLVTYQPQPALPIEDTTPSDLSVAVPDGRVDVTYNCNPGPESRINVAASVHMARRDAMDGKVVKLDFGPRGTYFLTKENWNAELPVV